jgi:hypothetical protein
MTIAKTSVRNLSQIGGAAANVFCAVGNRWLQSQTRSRISAAQGTTSVLQTGQNSSRSSLRFGLRQAFS